MADAGGGAGEPIDLARCADGAIGPLQLRPSLCEVEFGGVIEKLEPRVMQVLVALHRAEGRLVSRDALIETCWAGAVVGDDAINRVLVRLRRVVALTRGAVKIETVRSVGYRLLATPSPKASAAAPSPSPSRLGFARTLLSPLVLIALCGVALVLLGLLLAPARPGERLAVLAFRVGDASLSTYAETMAERIRGALSIGDLNTLARVSPAQYRGAEMAQLAARDGVGLVLDGVITRQGRDLVVLMQVIEPRSNLALWTKEYRRIATEDLWLEEQIAAHAAEVLRCALITRRSGARPITGEALGAFMRACDRVEQFEAGGADMLRAGRDLTRRAPRFSRAWSMLAIAAAITAQHESPSRAAALRQEAEQAAARALRLDRTNGESLLAQAMLAPVGEAFAARDALTSRAFQIDPSLSDAHIMRAFLLMEVGRTGEALSHAREASALDPLAPATWIALVPVLSANGQNEEARRIGERLLRVWPDSPAARFNTFKNRMFNGAPAEALAIMDQGGLPLHPEAQPALRAFLQAQIAGDAPRARDAVRTLADLARRGVYDLPSTISSASLSGDVDLAFEIAELYLSGALSGMAPATPARAATSHFMFLSPTANMRRDRRFMALAAQAGLIRYWRASGVWPDFCRRPDLPYDCAVEAALYDELSRPPQ